MKIGTTTLLLFLASLAVLSHRCRLLSNKGSLLIHEDSPFRCGTFFDQHFENKIKTFQYPDLGLVLANGIEIGLDEATQNELKQQA